MSKYETVCNLIKTNDKNLSRKDLVAKIAADTGFNPSTVNVYFSKWLNESKPPKVIDPVIIPVIEEDECDEVFVKTNAEYMSGGFEVIIEKQNKFLTSITVKHLVSGHEAVTTCNGSDEANEKAIYNLKTRLAVGDEKIVHTKADNKVKKSSSMKSIKASVKSKKK
jgi:hypothetical protein